MRTQLSEAFFACAVKHKVASPDMGWIAIGHKVVGETGEGVELTNKQLSDVISSYFKKGKGRKVLLEQEHPFLAAKCEEQGLPIENVRLYWNKTEDASIMTKMPDVEPEGRLTLEEQLKENLEEVRRYAPIYPQLNRDKDEDGCLFVVDPADPHFGKKALREESGDVYDLSLAEKRYAEGIEGLIKKASAFNIDQIVYVGGNDILHTDTIGNTTTAGTPQDIDSAWWNHYRAAKRALIAGLERLLTIADVHFVHCPSNHDYMSGFYLADSLSSWFAKNPNITFDIDPIHRKYFQYGSSLMGATHGNGAQEKDLPDLMKSEAKMAWARSKYAYFYVHHVHHKDTSGYKGKRKVILEKDYSDVTVLSTGKGLEPSDYCHVEYLRSQSGTDNYHFTKGYAHSKKAMEGFIHHKEYGQIARLTHLF